METLMRVSPATTFLTATKLNYHGFNNPNRNLSPTMVSTNPHKTTMMMMMSRRNKALVAVSAAAKKKQKSSSPSVDRHSFVSKPDEATGPYPEAVLLKKKVVQEDGTLLPEFADAEEQELFEYLNLTRESDLNDDRRRHYEVVYLIHEKHDEEVQKVNDKVQEFLSEKKGKMWRVNDWGLRRLAYKIQKANRAHYMLMNFELEAKWINDFKTLLDKDERVIRHLVIKRDEAITVNSPPPPEFHSLRAGMVGDDDDDDEDDDEFDDEEDWDDEEDEEEDGIIIVNTDEDGEDPSSTQSSSRPKVTSRNVMAELRSFPNRYHSG